MIKTLRSLLLSGMFLFALDARADELAQDLHESVASIKVTVKDMFGHEQTGTVVITQFRPDGAGPFPILMLNHGRSNDRTRPPRFRYLDQARFFVERGFAVFEATRIGYGEQGTTFDPEYSGTNSNTSYISTAESGSTEVLAALDYAKQQSYVDPKRVILLGQSVGGFVTTASAAKNPAGLIAAINFAGGAGGDPVGRPGNPRSPGVLEDMYAQFGSTTKVPMLWVYTQNDKFFGPNVSQSWHDAFVKAGGQAEYHLLPAFGTNGHYLFGSGIDVWKPVVSQFLDKIGFPAPTPAPTPAQAPAQAPA